VSVPGGTEEGESDASSPQPSRLTPWR